MWMSLRYELDLSSAQGRPNASLAMTSDALQQYCSWFSQTICILVGEFQECAIDSSAAFVSSVRLPQSAEVHAEWK